MSISNWEGGKTNFRAVHVTWGCVPTSDGCCEDEELIHGKALQNSAFLGTTSVDY